MREVDTSALQFVAPALGVGNPATATAPVTFDDDNLQQVLDVAPLVRRGQAPFLEGIILVGMETDHAGAGQETEAVNPWTAREGLEAEPPWFPDSLRERLDFDLWVLRCDLVATAGTLSNFNAGILRYATLQNSTLGSLQGTPNNQILGVWDGFIEVPSAINTATIGGQPGIYYPKMRLTRGSNAGGLLRFNSDASGAVTLKCQITLGLFPRGLGQDGAL